MPFDPLALVRPRRPITGISAVLLPYTDGGDIDWPGFAALLGRTAGCGLTPAVNMDTGYGPLLTPAERLAVLDRTRTELGGRPFIAGAVVVDAPGAPFDLEAYHRAVAPIVERGGTPVVCQSFGLTGLADGEVAAAYEAIGRPADAVIGFELGTMFAPFGKIYPLGVFAELLQVPRLIGAKHSSLNRQAEWDRLVLRDERRPDFKLFTGNDLAIDMVMYGSDYLLGLSTFAPEAFAERDRLWQAGDPGFYELNDRLQAVGWFTFRPPVPAYKHSAAQFLHLRGRIGASATHPRSPRRPDADVPVLTELATDLP
jgi:dihydrodipicolinate synthase/N-acetylneuraminate lyase